MRSALKALIALGVAALLASASAAPTAPSDTVNATAVVENLHAALLDSMKQGAGFAARRDGLAPVVRGAFDFESISRIVLGRFWASLKAGDQQAFIDIFTRLSIANYAARFDSFGGEQFRTLGTEVQQDGNALVRTAIVKGDGEIVKLDYLLHPDAAQHWRILNVVANGVSDLSLKRADYSSIMKNEGYSALLAKLNDKITQFEKPADGK